MVKHELHSVVGDLVVYEGNHHAISFHQRFGYVCYGRDFHDFEHIRVDFTVMNKDYGALSRGPVHD